MRSLTPSGAEVTAFQTRGFELVPWQARAVDAWWSGASPGRGTLEIFTGGGKTLIALACADRAAALDPELVLAVVVPTEALARQWADSLFKYTTLQPREIGIMGAGRRDRLEGHRALVAVLNSAAKYLPDMQGVGDHLMLVVDECHRAGAPKFSRVLTTPARFKLGLSATPEREELDESGEPLAYDEQIVGRHLGPVVNRFSLRDARRVGWLPEYRLHHHGLALHPDERQRYEGLSRRVDDLADQLRQYGVDSGRVHHLRGRTDGLGELASSYVALTTQRKDLLYRARERGRVAARIVADALASGPRRILIFHERVQEAEDLHAFLADALPDHGIRLEHSNLPDDVRKSALEEFRTGRASVLVSVKSLIEGIDVPAADVGISVASSSSVRQRVQSLGRVLRREFDANAEGDAKKATMHLLYMADTVDEFIYAREDWEDLTGEGANLYWSWSLDLDAAPEPQEGPPASPRPTEEQEWERLGGVAPTRPTPWLGMASGQEYSIDTLGTVTNMFGVTMANPQSVQDMMVAVRGRPGGRFRVTPEHRLVLVSADDGERGLLVAGQLAEPFVPIDEQMSDEMSAGDEELKPGAPYTGPADKAGGTFKLRQKHGGVIERNRKSGGTEFASAEDDGRRETENARTVLAAWHSLFDRGITFHVNELGHAWYIVGGRRFFFADVKGGFAWPQDNGGS